MRTLFRLVLAAVLLASTLPALAGDKAATVWKSPSCGCCQGWVEYLQRNGYTVKTIEVDDMDAVKKGLGVPPGMQSCHTARIGRYVVEGHVPVEAIEKLLAEAPDVAGIASPGMPGGSPGMNGPKEPNPVYSFSGRMQKLFGSY